MAEQETPQFNIELPEEVGQGQYANLAVVLHSQSEFILDFVRLLPGQQSARVHSRQILTPDNAKRLVRLLEQHLAGFEQEYGKIELPEDGAVEVNATKSDGLSFEARRESQAKNTPCYPDPTASYGRRSG